MLLKLTERISAHDYVDLQQLLKKQEKQNMNVHFDSNQGHLLCSQPEIEVSYLSKEKWTSGFLILAYVYLEKYASKLPLKAL